MLPDSMFARLALLLALGYQCSPAVAAGFSFDGYALGMPAASASMVKPYLAWQKVAASEGETSRLQFKASYLAREADAYVDLDGAGKYVKRIGFVFAASSDFDCLASSVLAADELRKTYGEGTAADVATGRKLQWLALDGYTLSWLEVCSAGGKAYSVIFSSK